MSMDRDMQQQQSPDDEIRTTRPVLAVIGLALAVITTWLFIDYALAHPDASGRAILYLSTYSALGFSWLLGWLSAMRKEGPFQVMLSAIFVPLAAMLIVYFSGLLIFG